MDKLRVIVADDSEFMRVAYKRILETQEHLEIVGMAADGEEAVRQAESTKPQVAILDVRMPKLNGIEAAEGQLIGLLERDLVVAGEDVVSVLLELLEVADTSEVELITL